MLPLNENGYLMINEVDCVSNRFGHIDCQHHLMMDLNGHL